MNAHIKRLVDTTGLCLSAIVVIFAIHAVHLAVVAEDSFITYRFASNLVAGEGLVWNPGEPPVEGYTNFLWLLISAALLAGGLDVPFWTQVLGFGAAIVTIAYTYRLGRELFGLSPTHALLPCALLAVSGPFATWATSGMETSLFGALVVGACYHFARWDRTRTARQLAICLVAVLTATLTRPEGVLVFAVLTMAVAWGPRELGRQFASFAALYVVPISMYVWWRYDYFGYLLPNTYYAKTGGDVLQYLRGIKYLAFFGLHFVVPFAPLAVALAWERPAPPSASRHWRRPARCEAVGVPAVAVLAVLYTTYVVYVGGDYMAMYRFFVPILPFVYLGAGVITSRLWTCIGEHGRKRALSMSLIVGAASLTLMQSTPLEQRLFRKPDFMHGTWQGVALERWAVERFKVIGEFFRVYTAPAQTLALEPIGVIPYYMGGRVHSIQGLVDSVIAHSTRETEIGAGMAGHEKRDLKYVLSKRPTYVMFSFRFTAEPQTTLPYSPDIVRLIEHDYDVRAVWLADRVNDEEGYFSFLALKSSSPAEDTRFTGSIARVGAAAR
jgi:arabinofuranosyltransferase